MIWDVYAAGSGPPLLVASDGGHQTIDPRLSALNPNADASKSSLDTSLETQHGRRCTLVQCHWCSLLRAGEQPWIRFSLDRRDGQPSKDVGSVAAGHGLLVEFLASQSRGFDWSVRQTGLNKYSADRFELADLLNRFCRR